MTRSWVSVRCSTRYLLEANLQEGRHALARNIFHGRSGQRYQRYQDSI
ncbi:hypothetical protein ACWGLF_36740 [Streptomyces puniciscabiei]